MTQAFTQTVTFLADSLVSPNLYSPESREAVAALVRTNPSDQEAVAAAQAAAKASFSPEMNQALANIGATYPSDTVQVGLELGSFLYETYSHGSIVGNAPLAKAAHKQRLGQLAARLDKPTFLLTADESAVIKKVLETPESWAASSYTAFIAVGDQKLLLKMNAQGAEYFSEVIEAATSLFLEPTDVTSAEPAVSAAAEG
jgi:hypothetical protein